MQTATMWLQEQIFNSDWKNMSGEDKLKLFEQAKEMEKQQIIDAHIDGQALVSCKDEYAEQYYNETYGSKGSDDINPLTSNHVDYQNHSNMSDNFKQFSLYEHKETITSADIKKAETMGLYDKIELENPNDSIFTSSQTEISDEEIEKAADKYVSEDEFNRLLECFEQGAKWYREQLKSRQ